MLGSGSVEDSMEAVCSERLPACGAVAWATEEEEEAAEGAAYDEWDEEAETARGDFVVLLDGREEDEKGIEQA